MRSQVHPLPFNRLCFSPTHPQVRPVSLIFLFVSLCTLFFPLVLSHRNPDLACFFSLDYGVGLQAEFLDFPTLQVSNIITRYSQTTHFMFQVKSQDYQGVLVQFSFWVGPGFLEHPFCLFYFSEIVIVNGDDQDIPTHWWWRKMILPNFKHASENSRLGKEGGGFVIQRTNW